MIAVCGEVFRDGDPGSDIVPVEGGFDIEDAGGLFHEGVVDGDGGEVGEFVRCGGDDVVGVLELINEAGEFRCVFTEFVGDGL